MHILKAGRLWGALEADLKRFYQEDARGLLTTPRRLTFRQVCVWIRHLPSDSALARMGWAGEIDHAYIPSLEEKLLGQVINEMRVLDYHLLAVNTDEKGRRKMDDPPLIEWEGENDDE